MEPDWARVAAHLAAEVPGFRGPIAAEKFAAGQSNPTFRLATPSGAYVLRRKPPGQLLKSAHAVDREFRVQRALAGSGVPVPRMLHLCEDAGVAGSAFYLMEMVEGRNFDDPRLPELTRADRAALHEDMNRVLAALHGVDPERVGLGDFGRPGNYFARQFERWCGQYRASETEAVPEMDALMGWLAGHLPADDGQACIVHGDYRLDNFIVAPDAPRIVAVLDWELSTLGHPVADLAYQCMQWRMPTGRAGRGLEGVDRAALGIPSEAEYVARYCERRGLGGIPDFANAVAFSFFRMAAIIQGVKKRGLDGNASDPARAAELGSMMPLYARRGLEAAGLA